MEGEARARLPDKAIVVRCGLPPFEKSPLHKACRRHPEGPFGFSVHAAVGMTVEGLATACPNASVGFTTVLEIRKMGYEIVATKAAGAPHHATVIVPEDWSEDEGSALALIFQVAVNPSPKKKT